MSDCCSSHCQEKSKPLKQDCPLCKHQSLPVTLKTMLHHIIKVWDYSFDDKHYYFCCEAGCDVVYFSDDGSVINKKKVRTQIGIKEKSEDVLICYCFGVSKVEACSNKTAKEFVIKQTKESICSCDTANPSGRCCLKDFPKLL